MTAMTSKPHVHPHSPDMLSVEDARDRILSLVHELPSTREPLLEADGLCLAADVKAPFDIPPVANSAMDGYAVRSADLSGAGTGRPVSLRVVGQVQAGQLASTPVEMSTTIRIMTGSPIPPGADAVVPFELTDEQHRRETGCTMDMIAFFCSPDPGDHIRPAGEDVRRGQVILQRGRVLDPPSIGMLAALGNATAPVVRRPVVALLATGDELQAPGTAAVPGRIYDINTYTVAAAVARYGGIPRPLGVVPDDLTALRDKLLRAMDADLVITSAGVSTGAFDLVRVALSEMGEVSFRTIRMRPSRPLAFGLLRARDGRMVPHLGLPGNPVSALVALLEFGGPAVARMMGKPAGPLPRVEAVLDAPIQNSDGRRVYARVTLERSKGVLHARPTGGQGSNLLTSLVLADGLAICPEDLPGLVAGDRVAVELLDWLSPASLARLDHPGATLMREVTQ